MQASVHTCLLSSSDTARLTAIQLRCVRDVFHSLNIETVVMCPCALFTLCRSHDSPHITCVLAAVRVGEASSAVRRMSDAGVQLVI